MNQSLQFPDLESLDQEKKLITFPAIYCGSRLTCAITEAELCRRYGKAPALILFRQHRWDLEEEAEQQILNQEEDEQGWYWLSAR